VTYDGQTVGVPLERWSSSTGCIDQGFHLFVTLFSIK